MPSRRPWQAPEHDGLLGKGSFPKPSGFGAGTSGPRPQSNDSHQLNRTNEPYHPPRPYKVKYPISAVVILNSLWYHGLLHAARLRYWVSSAGL